MTSSEITPEIIATKIWKWKLDEEKDSEGRIVSSFWVEPDGSVHRSLPTFLEPEWTGPLLAKAASISEAYMLRYRESYMIYEGGNGTERDYYFDIWKKGRMQTFPVSGKNKSLNVAIAEAILEAEGK